MVKSSLLSQAQYARRIGRSPSRISQLVRSGILVLVNGRVDPEQADIAIQAAIDQSRQARSEIMKSRNESRQMELLVNHHNEAAALSLTDTRQQHEALKLELTRLRLEIERGNLVPRNQQIEWLIPIISTARIRLLGLPRRTSETFAALTDPKKIEEVHMAEIKGILREMAAPLNLEQKKQALGQEDCDGNTQESSVHNG